VPELKRSPLVHVEPLPVRVRIAPPPIPPPESWRVATETLLSTRGVPEEICAASGASGREPRSQLAGVSHEPEPPPHVTITCARAADAKVNASAPTIKPARVCLTAETAETTMARDRMGTAKSVEERAADWRRFFPAQ